jgi:hypothetical protein
MKLPGKAGNDDGGILSALFVQPWRISKKLQK